MTGVYSVPSTVLDARAPWRTGPTRSLSYGRQAINRKQIKTTTSEDAMHYKDEMAVWLQRAVRGTFSQDGQGSLVQGMNSELRRSQLYEYEGKCAPGSQETRALKLD